jgi:hypothetical protein
MMHSDAWASRKKKKCSSEPNDDEDNNQNENKRKTSVRPVLEDVFFHEFFLLGGSDSLGIKTPNQGLWTLLELCSAIETAAREGEVFGQLIASQTPVRAPPLTQLSSRSR